MKRGIKVVLMLVFFGLITATLTSYVCLICYPEHPYFANVQRALLSEGGVQDDQPVVLAWAQGRL